MGFSRSSGRVPGCSSDIGRGTSRGAPVATPRAVSPPILSFTKAEHLSLTKAECLSFTKAECLSFTKAQCLILTKAASRIFMK